MMFQKAKLMLKHEFLPYLNYQEIFVISALNKKLNAIINKKEYMQDLIVIIEQNKFLSYDKFYQQLI